MNSYYVDCTSLNMPFKSIPKKFNFQCNNGGDWGLTGGGLIVKGLQSQI